MENKMKTFARLLGLELDEEFELSGSNDKYKLTLDGVMKYSTYLERWVDTDLPGQILTERLEIFKLPRQILTEEEKEYLSAVIKPFRDRVVSLEKINADDDYEVIMIGAYFNTKVKYVYIDLMPFKRVSDLTLNVVDNEGHPESVLLF